MDPRTFRVEGMTCASCVRRVEKALAAVPGVRAARVNLATEEATVEDSGVPLEALAKALEDRGYRLVPPQAPPEAPEGPWRVLVAWALTLPLLAGMVPGLHLHLPWTVQALLAGVVAFGAGSGFFLRAGRQLLQRETGMDVLVALGSLAAWCFGIAEGLRGEAHLPFETAAALVAFILVGKYLEARARHRATGGLEALLRLAPERAWRVEADGSETEVAASTLGPGDRVRVKPGMAVPLDGTVLEGRAEVEEALLTGEPLPVPRGPGDAVLAGAVVHGGAVVVRVDRAGADLWLARLARRVAQAQGSRAPYQDLADRVSEVFVPGVLILSALTLAGWWIHGGSLALAWRPAVTVLVIACPCALGLATPVAMAASLGTAARGGLLVRDAAAMARLAQVTDLVLDKTGTLTLGRPRLQEVRPLSDLPAGEVLRLASLLERDSAHPLARGIREAAPEAGGTVEAFRSHDGRGVTGRVEGRDLALGSGAFLGLDLPGIPEGAAAVGLAQEGRLLGILVLADEVRPEAAAVVAGLRASGLRLHLLSGDRPEAAKRLAATLGIPEAEGGCSPQDKEARLQALQAGGAVAAFVGDGVNDAPALARADAGISLPGLEAAQAAAPLNLLREGLEPLAAALRLARRTRAVIRQNLGWALGYNLVLVPLAAFGLLERVGGPMLAGAAMGLSSLTVVLNALRLRRL